MASQFQRFVNINFDAKGLDSIVNQQKRMAKQSEDTYKSLKQVLDDMEAAGKAGTKEWEEQNKQVKIAEKNMNTWQKQVDEATRDFNTVGEAIANIDQLGPRATAQLRTALNRMLKNISSYSEEAQEKIKMFASALDVVEARQQAFRKGVTDLGKGLSGRETFTELKGVIDTFEKSGKTLAMGADDYEEALRNMGRDATDAKIALAQMDGSLKAVNKDSTVGDIKSAKKFWEGIKGYAGATTEQVQKAEQEIARLNNLMEGKHDTWLSDDKFKQIYDTVGQGGKAVAQAVKEGNFSFDEFKEAYRVFREEIGKGGEEWNVLAARIRSSKEGLSELEGELGNTNEGMDSSIDSIRDYVAGLVSIGTAWEALKQTFNDNLQLSDQMADVRKTTGLSMEEVYSLTTQLQNIDTRASNESLMSLAASAGQLGIQGKDNILGFVKAANEITVSLDELGDEGVTSLMKVAQVTGDVNRLGIEKALKSTGSAINELTAASASSAGPIVDFIGRLGAVGSQAGLSMPEIAALGSTLDATAQSIEVGATSLSIFLPKLQTNTEGIANAVGMDAKSLKELVSSGQTMEAMIEVLEHFNQLDPSDQIAAYKEFGSEGARMQNIFKAMGGSLEELRRQLGVSKSAFQEATSITNEYNTKNNNANAVMERTGNIIKERFTNSGAVKFWGGLAQALNFCVTWFYKVRDALGYITPALDGLVLMIVLTKTRVLEMATAMTRAIFTTTTWTGAVAGLKSVFTKGNWLAALITALYTIGEYAIHILNTTSEMANQTKKLATETESETAAMRSLFDQLQNTNKGTKEYRDLINKINSTYGQYLGYMLSENDSLNTLRIARAKLNSELARTVELRERESNIQAANDANKDDREYQRSIIYNAYAKRLNPAQTDKAMAEVDRTIEQMLTKYGNRTANSKTMVDDINATLVSNLKNAGVYEAVKNQVKSIEGYYNEMAKQQQNIQRTVNRYNNLDNIRSQEAHKQDMRQLANWRKEYAKTMASATPDWERAAEINRRYRALAYKDFNASSASERKTMSAFIKQLKSDSAEISKHVKTSTTNIKNAASGGGSGNGNDKMDMASGWDTESLNKQNKAELNKRSKNLKAEWERYGEDDDISEFAQTVGQTFQTYNEAREWVVTTVKNMKQVAKSKGFNLEGGWSYGNKTDASTGLTPEKEPKVKDTTEQEMEDARKRLKEYYDERATMATEALNQGKTDQAAYNAFIAANNQELLANQRILEQKFIDKTKQFTTAEVNEWMKDIEGVGGQRIKINYDKIQAFLADKGKNLVGKIRENAANYGMQLQEQIAKQKEEIQKIIGEDNPFYSLILNMRDDMAKMGALLDVNEMLDLEDAAPKIEQRVKFLVDWIGNAYKKDAKQLVADIKARPELSVWAGMLEKDPDKAQAILLRVQNMYDQIQDAVKKESQRLKKSVEYLWNDAFKMTYEAPDFVEVVDTEGTNTLMQELVSAYNQNPEAIWTDKYLDEIATKSNNKLSAWIKSLGAEQKKAVANALNDIQVSKTQLNIGSATTTPILKSTGEATGETEPTKAGETVYGTISEQDLKPMEKYVTLHKMVEQGSKGTPVMGKSLKEQYEEVIKNIESIQHAVEQYNSAVGAGYMAGNVADNLDLKALKAKLQMQQALLALIKQSAMARIAEKEANEQSLRADAKKLASEGKLQEAKDKEKQADAAAFELDNMRKALGYILKDQNAEILSTTQSITDKTTDMQMKLVQYIKSWSEWLNSSVTSAFNAYGTQKDDRYTQLAVNRYNGTGDDDATEYNIVENAGTKDATVTTKTMTTNEKIQWEMEEEQREKQAEAWKEIMTSFSEKFNDMINDMITRWVDNQMQAQNTDATMQNTQALQQNTNALLNGGSGVSVQGANMGLNIGGASGEGASGTGFTPTIGTTGSINGDFAASMQNYQDSVKAMNKSLIKENSNTNKQISANTSATYASMMQAANLYGITYNAVMNDNLSTTQKVELVMIQSIGQMFMSMLSAAMSEVIAGNALNLAEATGKVFGQLGIGGFAAVAAITAAMGVAMGLATSAVSKAKSEIATATGSNTSAGKLTTGMLTYAKGRYPVYAEGYQQDGSRYTVTGNDGNTYDAVYKPNLTTGEYNRPHLGIVGEKGAELIVDHPTFARLKSQAPWILRGIYDMKRFGTTTLNHRAMQSMMQKAYPTHATGNVDSLGQLTMGNGVSESDTNSQNNEQLLETLSLLTSAVTELREQGVQGHFNVYGDDGLVKTYDKGKKFLTSIGK